MASSSPSILTAHWFIPIAEAAASPKEVWLDALSDCENPQASTTLKILDTNKYYSYGLFMFQMGTWLSYGKEFGATKQNIYDPNLQRMVARDMLDKGLWRHWYTCGKIIQKSLGSFPSAAD